MIFLVLLLSLASADTDNSDYVRGEYLARAAGCRECHTVPGQPDFSGGSALQTEFGSFYPPNITPDSKFGIGSWSAQDFHRALRYGISPQHTFYFPTFPYRSFSKMTDDDIRNLYVYLRGQRAVAKPNRPHDIWWPVSRRWQQWFWQEFFFQNKGQDPLENIKTAVGPFQPVKGKSAEWNRGAYLTEAVLHCAECHTPRNALGGLKAAEWMAGSEILFSGRAPPNITPHATGLQWTRAQWEEFLASGIDPEKQSPGVEMALVVRETSGLTRADRSAVVEYLMSLKPVDRPNREAQ